MLGLLPIRVDLPLESGLDVQELGAHGLRVALRGLRLALLATSTTSTSTSPQTCLQPGEQPTTESLLCPGQVDPIVTGVCLMQVLVFSLKPLLLTMHPDLHSEVDHSDQWAALVTPGLIVFWTHLPELHTLSAPHGVPSSAGPAR